MTRDEMVALMSGGEFASFAEMFQTHRPAWMADAACREHPEVSWFPDRGQDSRPAKAVCAGCLVREECAAYALEVPLRGGRPVLGVWGGTSEKQRKLTRRGAEAA